MSDPFIGQIMAFAGNFAPRGWALCQGQLLSIQQNTALFSLLGTVYGGNGVSTFGLPDLRGRAIVGAGQGPGLSDYVIGQLGGAEQVTLTRGQLPAHSHLVNAQAVKATLPSPSGNVLGVYENPNPASLYAPANPSPSNPVTMAPTMIQATGNNVPVPTTTPYQCINYCIALVGIFPTRS